MALEVCPRCQGNLFLERDIVGPHWSCLQCGYIGHTRLAARQRSFPMEKKEPPTPAKPMWLRYPYTALVLRDDGRRDGELSEKLARLGCEVAVASTYEEGERLLNCLPFHLIFMEAQRPSLGVAAMSKRIRNRWPGAVLLLAAEEWDEEDGDVVLGCVDGAFRGALPLRWIAQALEAASLASGRRVGAA